MRLFAVVLMGTIPVMALAQVESSAEVDAGTETRLTGTTMLTVPPGDAAGDIQETAYQVVNVVENLGDGRLLHLDSRLSPGVIVSGQALIGDVEIVRWVDPNELPDQEWSSEAWEVIEVLLGRNGRVGEGSGWMAVGNAWVETSFICISLDLGSNHEGHYVFTLVGGSAADLYYRSRASGVDTCGPEPTCESSYDGIQECIDSAACRQRRCGWSYCVTEHWDHPDTHHLKSKDGYPINPACDAVYIMESAVCMPSGLWKWIKG